MPLLALVLMGHAFMHVGAVMCGLLFAATPPGFVASAGIDLTAAKAAAVGLTSIAGGAYLLAAMSSVRVCVPASWWRPLVAVASLASAVMLVALFSPPAVPGLVIDAALLWAVFVLRWNPSRTGGPSSRLGERTLGERSLGKRALGERRAG